MLETAGHGPPLKFFVCQCAALEVSQAEGEMGRRIDELMGSSLQQRRLAKYLMIE